MSRAFTREQDDAPADVGERPVSPHRNLVTPSGLARMDHEISTLQQDLARANAEGDKERIARASRDLRYWHARRETAEVSIPDPASTVVRFGMAVTITDGDDRSKTWTIVGEDDADASQGRISHVSPVAVALFGRELGDEITINGKSWEITAFHPAE